MVEFSDFQCPFCSRAVPAVKELEKDFGRDVRLVWKHLPLPFHQNAMPAALAAEAARQQGKFWEMHDMLMDHQDALNTRDLIGYAEQIGLDTAKFTADLRKHAGAYRVAEDVDSADLATVSGTPTFFINGKRHYGAFDLATLTDAVKAAKALAVISGGI